MNSSSLSNPRRLTTPLLLVGVLAVICQTVAHAQQQVPVPKVRGPIAITAASYPFAHVRNVDLEAAGYIEEEYFISGSANVYDWNASGTGVTVRSANAPYTTRIMVVRPKDAQRFNGRVMVDVMNMTNGWDFHKIWAVMHDHLLEDGWVYVGITSKPNSVRALKTFDPQRYASLSWANPLPLSDSRNCENLAADSRRETENGLTWDIFSQVGALLRSHSASNPLHGLRVERQYLVGYSQSSFFLHTYISAIHPLARRERGLPVWDGYLLSGGPGGVASTPINQCAAPIPAGDPRTVTRASDVPVIDVIGAMDVLGGVSSYSARRDDSDAPNDRFRLYEVPGGSHSWLYQLGFNSSAEDVKRAGFDNYADRVPTACTIGEPNHFPLHYVLNASLDNLDRWASTGVPAPRVPRLEIETVDGQLRYVTDADGNLKGGYRLPQIEVPIGVYHPTNNRDRDMTTGCWSWGHYQPFGREKLLGLYPTQNAYVSQVAARSAALVRNRLLTAGDARRIVETAANTPVP